MWCGVVECVLCGVVWLNVELQSAVPSSPYPCCVHSLAMGHVCTAMCTDHHHFSRLGHGSTKWVGRTHCLVHVVCSICNIQVHRVVCMRFTCTYTVAALCGEGIVVEVTPDIEPYVPNNLCTSVME